MWLKADKRAVWGPSLCLVWPMIVSTAGSRSADNGWEERGRRETGADVTRAASDTDGDDDVGDGDDTDKGERGGRSVNNEDVTVFGL